MYVCMHFSLFLCINVCKFVFLFTNYVEDSLIILAKSYIVLIVRFYISLTYKKILCHPLRKSNTFNIYCDPTLYI